MTSSAATTIICWGTAVGLIVFYGLDVPGWLRRRLERRAESWNRALDELEAEAVRPDPPVLPTPSDPDGWGEWDWDDPPPVARTVEELERLANVPWPRGKTFH